MNDLRTSILGTNDLGNLTMRICIIYAISFPITLVGWVSYSGAVPWFNLVLVFTLIFSVCAICMIMGF